MPTAITGATGRLGSAIVGAFTSSSRASPGSIARWDRLTFDLDSPGGVGATLDAGTITMVVHCAAWTDVDACALEPDLALQRNGVATGVLAQACSDRGIDLLVVSTNEVFDGTRKDREPYAITDDVSPANAYGASKLAGERAAIDAYARPAAHGELGIVRTAWLFGPGRPDFPTKIAAAAIRASGAKTPLRVVADEIGTPTYAIDVAEAIQGLVDSRAFAGINHVVNAGQASRADWARDVIRRLRVDVVVEDVGLDDFQRPSRPPRWGVLAPTPLAGGPLRTWQDAMKDYETELRRSVTG